MWQARTRILDYPVDYFLLGHRFPRLGSKEGFRAGKKYPLWMDVRRQSHTKCNPRGRASNMQHPSSRRIFSRWGREQSPWEVRGR